MGIQEYFGQDEKLAGIAAGEKLNNDGAKKALCVIQEQGQVGARGALRRRHPGLQG